MHFNTFIQIWSFHNYFAGVALCEVGESFCQMSEIKDSLDISVKQNFIDPLQQLCDKDIKEVMVS